MTVQELASKSADDVRNNNELMGLYIEKYKDLFGFEPNCASCTFAHDFLKFQQKARITNGAVAPQNHTKMANTTFKIKAKYRNEIHTYRVGNKPFRTYGHLMTEEFAKEFLKNADKSQKKDREEIFEVLPETPKKASKKSKSKTKAVAPEKVEAVAEVVENKPEEVVADPLPRKKTGRKKNS